MSTQNLAYAKDQLGHSTNALAFTTDTKNVNLASLATSSITVPSSFSNWVMLISLGNSPQIWVAVNDTAASPAGGSFATTTSLLNPSQLKLRAGDVVNFYNAGGSTLPIGVSMYALD